MRKDKGGNGGTIINISSAVGKAYHCVVYQFLDMIIPSLQIHYGIIYHVHHPCLLFSHINIIMQIMYIKGTTWSSVVFIKYQIN